MGFYEIRVLIKGLFSGTSICKIRIRDHRSRQSGGHTQQHPVFLNRCFYPGRSRFLGRKLLVNLSRSL